MNFYVEISQTVSSELIRNEYYTLIYNVKFGENTPFLEALFGVAELSCLWIDGTFNCIQVNV